MLKNEFLEKVNKEALDKNNNYFIAINECFKEILKTYSSDTNIDDNKSIEDCYKKMYEYADSKKVDSCYCFVPTESEKFIREYLGLKEQPKIRLEDYI